MSADLPSALPQTAQIAPQRSLQAVCGLLACLACLPSLRLISHIWADSEYLAHGYLIPLVALLILWLRRERVAAALQEGGPSALGPLAVAAAVGVQTLAVMGDVIALAGLMVPVLLGATALAVAGPALARALAVPLGFLVLMVPPPGFLTTRLLFNLKLVVTELSVRSLRLFDYPIANSGNQIFVPGHELFVADACSGLTSIITMLPLAGIIAYFLGRTPWRSALIFVSVVPLAILANVIRVVVTVGLVGQWGIEAAQGALHESFGLATYLLGTLALIGVARALR